MITQDLLKEIILYNHETGVLTSKSTGKVFCYVAKRSRVCGYITMTILGKRYYAHRIAWLYHYGSLPECIDHIDGDGLNNKISNLRSVTKLENNKNSSMRIDNTSGHKGVFYSKQLNKWCAQIRYNNKTMHIGYFAEINDAIKARKEKEIKYGYHENHGKILSEFKTDDKQVVVNNRIKNT